MTYRQVRDILEYIRKVHRQMRDVLTEMEQESDSSLAAWMAHVFSRHEQHWQISLAQYEKTGQEGVLNTWLQYVPTEAVQQEMRDISLSRDMTIDGVAAAATRFHTALVGLYETLAEETSVPRVQQLFRSLLEMERSVATQEAWAARKE